MSWKNLRRGVMAETRNLEGELVLWGRWWDQLETVEYEEMGRLSSENDQWYGNKPWAGGRTWAVNLWVISLMCLQPWEWRQSLCLTGTSKKRGKPKGSWGHEGEPEADGKCQENWKVSRETGEFYAGNVKGTFSKKWVEKSNEDRRKDSENEIERKHIGCFNGSRWLLGANLSKEVRVKIGFQGVQEGLGRKETALWTLYSIK